MRWLVVLLVGSCLVLAGCYPSLKVVQPRVDLSVVDADGRGIEDATLTLATYSFPFPTAQSTAFATYRTDADGALHIRQRRKWVMQVALADGIGWYEWGYCIEKPGYLASGAARTGFDEPLTVVLERAQQQAVCEWLTDSGQAR